MIKHASSHGLSVLVCSVLAAYLVETTKPIWPDLNRSLMELTYSIHRSLQLQMDVKYLSIIIAASILSIIWGILFKLLNNN